MNRASSASPRTERAFHAMAALLFAGSAALTIVWSRSMAGEGMPMSGGWTMSMMWMRMPGQTWFDAWVDFIAMWLAMMIAPDRSHDAALPRDRGGGVERIIGAVLLLAGTLTIANRFV